MQTLPILSKSEFEKLMIKVPVLDVQLKISSHLAALDRRIEHTQQELNLLSELRRKAYEVKRDNDCRNEAYILFSESGFTQELIQNAHKAGNVILIG